MKLRLTKAGRVVIFVLIAAIVCTGGFFAWKHFGDEAAALIDSFGSDKLEQNVVEETTTPNKTETNKEQNVDVSII